MDSGQVKVFVQHNWPYLLGGAIGIYVVLKVLGNHSQAAAPADNSGQFMALMNAQAAQSAGQSAQIALANKNLDNQNAIAMRSLDVQNAQGNNQAQVAWMQSQGDAAMKTAGAAAMLVDALNRPAVQAIGSAANATAAGLAASGMVGVAGFQAQAQTVTAVANVINNNTNATAHVLDSSMAKDVAIAKANAQVQSTALQSNATINNGYYGAYASVAKSFMSQPQVTNYANAPVTVSPQQAAGTQNVPQANSLVQPLMDWWQGGTTQSNTGTTDAMSVGVTPQGGSATLAALYGNAGYG